MNQLRLGFVGAGQMATALARGFVQSKLVSSENLLASDVVPAALEAFCQATGGRAAADNRQVAAGTDVLFLSVKPQHVPAALGELRGTVTEQHLVVSIAAGISTATLSEGLGLSPRIVRVMPNTPCLVGYGASGYSLASGATPEDGQLVARLLSTVGLAFQLPESSLDAVTGLSGSGPAFVYLMIEALADGGVRMGLSREVATALAVQTVRGAAEMVHSTGLHPGQLKDQVASPGGTTIAGLHVLEREGLRGTLMSAVEAAARRSEELGKRG